jgi:hypothetical protein
VHGVHVFVFIHDTWSNSSKFFHWAFDSQKQSNMFTEGSYVTSWLNWAPENS